MYYFSKNLEIRIFRLLNFLLKKDFSGSLLSSVLIGNTLK